MEAAARGGNVNTNIGRPGNARRDAEGAPSDERIRDQRLMVYAQTSCPSMTFGFSGLARFTALAGGRTDRRSRVLAAG